MSPLNERWRAPYNEEFKRTNRRKRGSLLGKNVIYVSTDRTQLDNNPSVLWGQVVVQTRGRHLILDFWGCASTALNDALRLEGVLRECAHASGATVVGALMHAFAPQGVTGVLLLEESHVSIHTWPEKGYAAVDFYTCGDGDPQRAKEILMRALMAQTCDERLLDRGTPP